MAKLNVVWFKRDLRIADHLPLARAALRGRVLPLLVIEPEYWRQPDTSRRQYKFLRECAIELDLQLGRFGQPFVVMVGDVLDEIGRASCRERV